jgi:hypothetical protein
VKLAISEVPTVVPTSLLPSALNRTSPGEEPFGQGNGRTGERPQMAAGIEREAGVVAAAVVSVSDVDQPSMHGDADWLDTARGNGPPPTAQLTVGVDAQHRDLIAAGLDREQYLRHS